MKVGASPHKAPTAIQNLEANKFWKAIGFNFLYLEPKITQRTKKGINHWIYKIKNPRQYTLII